MGCFHQPLQQYLPVLWAKSSDLCAVLEGSRRSWFWIALRLLNGYCEGFAPSHDTLWKFLQACYSRRECNFPFSLFEIVLCCTLESKFVIIRERCWWMFFSSFRFRILKGEHGGRVDSKGNSGGKGEVSGIFVIDFLDEFCVFGKSNRCHDSCSTLLLTSAGDYKCNMYASGS